MPESRKQKVKSKQNQDKPSRKQAVIVIHGMGEQRPMTTLQDFVKAVWNTDTDLVEDRLDGNIGEKRMENPVWGKPDRRNRSYELRRITTEEDKNGVRTDFYEFYWAHLMQGTTWEHVKIWLSGLLLRGPDRVPKNVMSIWLILWAATFFVGAFTFYSLIPSEEHWLCKLGLCTEQDGERVPIGALIAFLGVVGAAITLGFNTVALKYFGDVARYVNASPLNVSRRQQIREKGVELLETVLGCQDLSGATYEDKKFDPKYERVVVVGHSLGSIVAYDILKHSFARLNRLFPKATKTEQPKRRALENFIQHHLDAGTDMPLLTFRQMQADCLAELKAQGHPWVVTDFITLGSPLTHAEFLLGKDEPDMRRMQNDRILPTCPPKLEWDSDYQNADEFFEKEDFSKFFFTYMPGEEFDRSDPDAMLKAAEGFRLPHHAAHFAFTRWTNVYSEAKAIAWGDVISGPLAQTFCLKKSDQLGNVVGNGATGILDIPVLSGHIEGADDVERPETTWISRPARPPAKHDRIAHFLYGRFVAKPRNAPFFTHTKYWDFETRSGSLDVGDTPAHIMTLRKTLNLLQRPEPEIWSDRERAFYGLAADGQQTKGN